MKLYNQNIMKRSNIKFGMMNHPAKDTIAEIYKAAELGFDYIDLTLEPPCAGTERFNFKEVKKAIDINGLGIVGHTGWHLNAEAAYPEVRKGVGDSMLWAAKEFSKLGAKYFTYHIRGMAARYIGLKHSIKSQVEVLKRVSDKSNKMGIKLVIEHVTGYKDQFEILDNFFKKIPKLGFHLDVGHANISDSNKNMTPEFLSRYGRRLTHVHFSDNRGRTDDHLPLGVGNIDWKKITDSLKRIDYCGTITLEVFSEDDDYVKLSLKKARTWFSE